MFMRIENREPNNATCKAIARAVDNCARIGLPYEYAAAVAAKILKDRGYPITDRNLDVVMEAAVKGPLLPPKRGDSTVEK